MPACRAVPRALAASACAVFCATAVWLAALPGLAAPSRASSRPAEGDQWLSERVTWAGGEGTWAHLLPELARAVGVRLVASLPGTQETVAVAAQIGGSRAELLGRISEAGGWEVALEPGLVALTPEEGVPGGVIGSTTAKRARGKEYVVRLLETLDEDKRTALRAGVPLVAADFTKAQQDALLALARDHLPDKERGKVVAANLASTTLQTGLYPLVRVAADGLQGKVLRIPIGVRDFPPGALAFDPTSNTLGPPDAGTQLGRPPLRASASGRDARSALDHGVLDPLSLPGQVGALQRAVRVGREVLRLSEAVDLLAEATRLQITLDRRYGAMPCFVTGGAYQARELLSTLCWAFGLEVREVGPLLHLGPAQVHGMARVLERRNVSLLRRIHELLGVRAGDAPVRREASVLTADLFEEPGKIWRLSALTPEQQMFIEGRLSPETQLLLGDAEVTFVLGVRVVVDPHIEREVESTRTRIDERGRIVPLTRIERYRISWIIS